MEHPILAFDVGNVIVKADHTITHKILEDKGVHPKRSSRFFNVAEYTEFSRGRLTPEAFSNLMRGTLGTDISDADIRFAHNSHIFGVDNSVLRILGALRQSRICFITDTNVWQTEREKELVNLERYSKAIFRSNEIGLTKRDPGCFGEIVRLLGVNPKDVLLIDDSLKNTEVALESGLRAMQFLSPSKLTRDLRLLGIQMERGIEL